MSTDLRDVLRERLADVPAPPGDLDRVRATGRRLRRRRWGAAGTVAVLAAGAVVAALAAGGPGPNHPSEDRGIDPVGQLDFSHGLRAYADPGGEIHLGGRTFPADRLDFLDTDATATPSGILFYDRGVPRLLAESGEITDLEPDATGMSAPPTPMVDSQGPVVAYGAELDGESVVRVRDLESGDLVASRAVPGGTVIDGIDGGDVFLRTGKGTTVWDTRTDEERAFAGPETRVADVRNGVVLYDGPPPGGPAATAYQLVKGAIDAQLTYDGAYVLYWSSRLEPTTPGGDPVLLDAGTGPGPTSGWWAIDTDGSILVALAGKGSSNQMYDCEVPSGACTDLGPLTTTGGDPMFIGVDM
jgi:hypothetical protein